MKTCEKLLKNPKYLEAAYQIGSIKFITDNKWDWEHGFGHFKRVSEYVKIILEKLGADERTVDIGMTAALLHDIGLANGCKDGHALRSGEMFTNYIELDDFSSAELLVMKQAILDHSKGENISSKIGLALVLADKLDVTYQRTINSSIQDEVNKEIQKIKKIDIDISKHHLTVNYTTSYNFNLSILHCWPKAITIPYKVAKYLNKSFIFKINDKQTDISSFIS